MKTSISGLMSDAGAGDVPALALEVADEITPLADLNVRVSLEQHSAIEADSAGARGLR